MGAALLIAIGLDVGELVNVATSQGINLEILVLYQCCLYLTLLSVGISLYALLSKRVKELKPILCFAFGTVFGYRIGECLVTLATTRIRDHIGLVLPALLWHGAAVGIASYRVLSQPSKPSETTPFAPYKTDANSAVNI